MTSNVDSFYFTSTALESVGVSQEDAEQISRDGVLVGEIGHLYCSPEIGQDIILAYDADVPLVIRGGQVVAMDGTNRLVNTSVRAFYAVVMRYQDYIQRVSDVDDDEEGKQIAKLAISDMRALDIAAFESGTYYWPIVCQQMMEGQL